MVTVFFQIILVRPKMTIHDYAHAFAVTRFQRVRYLFDSVEDLENSILAELVGFYPRDIVTPEIVPELERQFQRLIASTKQRLRRACRRTDRAIPIEDRADPATADSRQLPASSELFIEAVVGVKLTAFEREALLAQAGLHPRFRNFREFASAQDECC